MNKVFSEKLLLCIVRIGHITALKPIVFANAYDVKEFELHVFIIN